MDGSNINRWFEIPRFSTISIAIIPYARSYLHAGGDFSNYTPLTQLDFDLKDGYELRERTVTLGSAREVMAILKTFVQSLKGQEETPSLKDNYIMIIHLSEYRFEVQITKSGDVNIIVYKNDEVIQPHNYEECGDLDVLEPIVTKILNYLNSNGDGYLVYRKEAPLTVEFFKGEMVADLEELTANDQAEIDFRIAQDDLARWVEETGEAVALEQIDDVSVLAPLMSRYVQGRLEEHLGTKLELKDKSLVFVIQMLVMQLVGRMGSFFPNGGSEEDILIFNFFTLISEFNGEVGEDEQVPWSKSEDPMAVLTRWIGPDLARVFKKYMLNIKILADALWNQRNSRGGTSGFDASEA